MIRTTTSLEGVFKENAEFFCITQNEDGELYVILADEAKEILEDWHGECNYVPANEASVYCAEVLGEVAAEALRCTFGDLMNSLTNYYGIKLPSNKKQFPHNNLQQFTAIDGVECVVLDRSPSTPTTALISRLADTHEPFVVVVELDEERGEWGYGMYFSSLQDALKYLYYGDGGCEQCEERVTNERVVIHSVVLGKDLFDVTLDYESKTLDVIYNMRTECGKDCVVLDESIPITHSPMCGCEL